MCDVLKILKSKSAFLFDLEVFSREAADLSISENASATNIQRAFRGSVARYKITIKNKAANEIQRVFRGHMGRKKARSASRTKMDKRQMSIFSYFILQLQKSFRGYYSRKYRHDFFRRKRYVNQIAETGEQVRSMMQKYADEQMFREEQENEDEKDRQFKTYAENLHHLVSTKHVPGVFNPNQDCVEMPMMRGIPVEDHVRGVVKDLLRTRGISKTGQVSLVPDLHGSRKIPLKGLKNRLSLQASAPYDVVQKEQQQQKALHRILTTGKGNFFAGGRTKLIDHNELPLCTDDPHMDAWANPLMMKGVPENQQQLEESAYFRKPLFISHIERPFYLRAEGNKSTALPNDVFDVIAEAEETGGSVQRHLGNTTRFGLPTSADNRPPEGNGTIPAPPIRTSSFKITRPRATAKLTARTLRSTAQVQMSRSDGAQFAAAEESSDEDEY